MAKIQEEIIVVKVSRLLRDSEDAQEPILNDQAMENLEVVIQELTGDNVLVEIIRE
jgi:hypothetical protein